MQNPQQKALRKDLSGASSRGVQSQEYSWHDDRAYIDRAVESGTDADLLDLVEAAAKAGGVTLRRNGLTFQTDQRSLFRHRNGDPAHLQGKVSDRKIMVDVPGGGQHHYADPTNFFKILIFGSTVLAAGPTTAAWHAWVEANVDVTADLTDPYFAARRQPQYTARD